MRRPRNAFTLIELLVVVAIVAVLLSIIAPTLGKIRALTRHVKCVQHLNEQARAHTAYGLENEDFKPPIAIPGIWFGPRYISPNTKQWGYEVGQGLLVKGRYCSFAVLLCPSATMKKDIALDRKAWEARSLSGSSYAYYWLGPELIANQRSFPYTTTYTAAALAGKSALAMDINAEEGHKFHGDFEGYDWVSHPVMGKVNISYIEGTVRSAPTSEVILRYPAGREEELDWFDQAHRRGLHRGADEGE